MSWVTYRTADGYVVAITDTEPGTAEDGLSHAQTDLFAPGDEFTYYIIINAVADGQVASHAAVRQSPPAQELLAAQAAAVQTAQALTVAATATLDLDTLADQTLAAVAPLYPEWQQPTGAHDAYPEDVVVHYDDALWRSTTAANVHQPGTSGWHRYGTADEGPQPWVQPSGAHDAYPAGATVTHDGKTWENTHGDGNIWMPGSFGWTEVNP